MHQQLLAVPLPEETSHSDCGGPLGYVFSVTGSRAVIAAENLGPKLDDDPMSVGKLLAIHTKTSRVIALTYAAEAVHSSTPSKRPDKVLVSVELVGEITSSASSKQAEFDRGIQSYPTVGASVHPIDAADLAAIFDHHGKQTIQIGQIAQNPEIPASLRAKDLLQKHFAVLGTTGCGKSSAVSLILGELLKASPATRVLLIDPHNEYQSAFSTSAEVISPRNLSLPFWLFSFEELVDVIYRRRPGVEEELDALADLIPMAKARFAQGSERATSLLRRETDASGFTVDSPVPYRVNDIYAMIDEQLGKLDGREERPKLRRLKSRIQSVVQDTRYEFMFSRLTVEDTMVDLLSTLFRVPAEGKPMTIVEMAGFPAEVVDAVVSVLCRLAFELGIWGGGQVPLLVLCEEAHRYVPADKRLGFGPTRRAISRIAKEGRKYGVHLGLVTQRPAELDPTILSQCSTIFAMRMASEADHNIIRSAVSDAASSILSALPAIGNREAIAFGEAVPTPVRIRFASLPAERLPGNNSTEAQADVPAREDRQFMHEVVQRWRAVAQRGI